MAKKFKSLEDVAKYIKNSCSPDIMDEIETVYSEYERIKSEISA